MKLHLCLFLFHSTSSIYSVILMGSCGEQTYIFQIVFFADRARRPSLRDLFLNSRMDRDNYRKWSRLMTYRFIIRNHYKPSQNLAYVRSKAFGDHICNGNIFFNNNARAPKLFPRLGTSKWNTCHGDLR